MSSKITHNELIARWPSPAKLAADAGVGTHAVYRWQARGSLWPARIDLDMIAAAKRRGFKLTLSEIAHARRNARKIVDHAEDRAA